MFWSEIGSGFREPGGTPPPKILISTPPTPPPHTHPGQISHNEQVNELGDKT